MQRRDPAFSPGRARGLPARSAASASSTALTRQSDLLMSGPRDEDMSSRRLPAFLLSTSSEIKVKFQHVQHNEARRLHEPIWNSESLYVLPHPSTKAKNRYANVQPWETNRVRLQVPQSHSDYINASPIALRLPPRGEELRYIAMQGPRADNVSQVWRMIWQQCRNNSGMPAVIVMLTETHEAGIQKCAQYFPRTPDSPPITVGSEAEFGDDWTASVRCISLDKRGANGACEVRRLILTSTTAQAGIHNSAENANMEELVVHHLLYTRWPDFGVPSGADVDSFLDLITLSHQLSITPSHAVSSSTNSNLPTPPRSQSSLQPTQSPHKPSHTLSTSPQTSTSPLHKTSHTPRSPLQPLPRIIHCSAGVGRSGTFIALDALTREMRAGAFAKLPRRDGIEVDRIVEVVEALRQQRMMMVQAEPQFALLYALCHREWDTLYGSGDGSGGVAGKAGRAGNKGQRDEGADVFG